jgi:membrane protease YdiL (CAAX protease family)
MESETDKTRDCDRPVLRRPGRDLAFFLAFVVVWALCARVFWYSPVNGLLETSLGRTATDLVLRAINIAVRLGFSAAYLRATNRERPLSYLKLRHNASNGLAIGFLVGLAFVAKEVLRVLLLEGRLPELAGLTPLTFLSPFVEEVMFRGLVLQQAEEYTGFWRAIAISAGLFGGIHLQGWIFAGIPLSEKAPRVKREYGL